MLALFFRCLWSRHLDNLRYNMLFLNGFNICRLTSAHQFYRIINHSLRLLSPSSRHRFEGYFTSNEIAIRKILHLQLILLICLTLFLVFLDTFFRILRWFLQIVLVDFKFFKWAIVLFFGLSTCWIDIVEITPSIELVLPIKILTA